MESTATDKSHQDWIGRTAYDSAGSKLGDITNVFYDDLSGRPEWLTVSTGWFGTNEQFVPITGTAEHDDGVRVAHTEDHIKDAPSIDVDDDHLDADEERRLYEHYDLDFDTPDPMALYGDRARADDGFEIHDVRETHDSDVHVGGRDSGRRLHKYVTGTSST